MTDQPGVEVRCPSKMHGILVEPDTWEVRCKSDFCQAGPEVVVFHRFNTKTGQLIETLRFRSLDEKTRKRKGD